MSQPMTQTEKSLEEFRKAGVPIEKASRPFVSKRMKGFNADVYTSWIQRWATNCAANYPVIKGSEGINFLRNSAKNIPAVVVGIGPSLDRAFEDLERAPRHAVIIATDAALRPLLRRGIRPDIVLNYDARDEQSSMWETIDTRDLVLVANSVTSPKTIAAWNGPIMFFNMLQSDDEFCVNILPAIYPFLGHIPNAGTVGNGAVLLANFMGCKPILTIGMDLCYRERENEKTSGFPLASWRYRCDDFKLLNTEWVMVENKILYDNDQRLSDAFDEEIKGVKFMTDPSLKKYREALLEAVGRLDIPLIDCSDGVLSGFVKSMTLRSALEEKCYPVLEPGQTVVKHLKSLIPAANRDWRLIEEAKIFVLNKTASLWPRVYSQE